MCACAPLLDFCVLFAAFSCFNFSLRSGDGVEVRVVYLLLHVLLPRGGRELLHVLLPRGLETAYPVTVDLRVAAVLFLLCA